MEQIVHSPDSLGQALLRQRKLLNLTQVDAGKSYKLDQGTISDIENGASGTRIETVFRVMSALGLELVVRDKKDTTDGDW